MMTLGQLLDALRNPSQVGSVGHAETVMTCLADEALNSFNLSARLIHALGRNDILSLSSLLRLTERQVRKMRGMGVKTCDELFLFLDAHNLKLADEI